MVNDDIDIPYDTELLNYHDLPQWMKDNENERILTSYRKPTYSYILSLKTIWDLHNETVNIWTHLLGTYHSLPLHPPPIIPHSRSIGLYDPTIIPRHPLHYSLSHRCYDMFPP